MAKQRKKAAAKSAANAVSTEDKFLRLLAMLVVRGIEDKQEQALILSGVGFDASEIADMLRVGNNYVNVAIHRKNTKTKKPRGARS